LSRQAPRRIESDDLSRAVLPVTDDLGLLTALGSGGDASRQPLPVRIRDALILRIQRGELRDGARLPPIRTLAVELAISAMTIAKAYKLLGAAGYAEARTGGGTIARRPANEQRQASPGAFPARPSSPGNLSQLLFELARSPGVIGFTGNYPTPELSDAEAFRAALARLTARPCETWFRYDPPAGREELLARLPGFLARHGIAAASGEMLVTSGAQQALDIVVRALVRPGEAVAIERPSYYGLINVLRAAGARIFEVPLQADGLDLDVLEDVLRREQPRLVCVNPTFQNPTGITMSRAKREALLALVRRTGVALLEDDHSPELRFSGAALPSIRALAGPSDPVFYARGFGKVYVPGVRLGVLVAPAAALPRLLEVKTTSDLQSPAIMQGALAEYLADPAYHDRVAAVARTYAARQKHLTDALRSALPPETEWRIPEGGLSLWLRLPPPLDVTGIYYPAARCGVTFAPGEPFYASNPDLGTLRLSFGLTPAELLAEGADRLAAVIRSMAQPSAPASAMV
jgi:DNA-binding transcriptional MocR family regulator